MAAKRDAETDTNKVLWTGVGCAICLSTVLGGFVGVGIGSLGPQSYSGGCLQLISDEQMCGLCIGAPVGCLIPLIVINTYRLVPPPERLLGKSPQYVDFYTDAYKTRIQLLRMGWAAGGTLIGLSALVLVGSATN